MDRGFLYLTFGERCLKEAVESAQQLRRWHHEPICLITDQELSKQARSMFDCVQVVSLKHDYRDKLLISNSPYEKTIFLDSDTFVSASLEGLFDVLDRFDVGVQFTEGGNHYSLVGVPSAFYEPSAGIIAWKRSSETQSFFAKWVAAYDEIEAAQGQPGAWDQRSLRQALYESSVRIFPIPPEYQFYTYRPNIVAGQVRMIHGRGLTPRQIRGISESLDFRIWIPKVGWCPVPAYAQPHQLMWVGFSLIFRSVALAARRFLAWTRLMPYPINRRPA